MNKNEVAAKVQICLRQIERNEKEIIQNDINERTIVHKLAEYLQREFPRHNVDMEYNRNFERGMYAPKYASIVREGFEAAYQRSNEAGENIIEFMDQVTTYPDIIVHKRMNNDRNLLAIEVKKNNNKADWAIDYRKLEAFTRRREDGGYGYTFGLHVVFYTDSIWKVPDVIWYENGVRCP